MYKLETGTHHRIIYTDLQEIANDSCKSRTLDMSSLRIIA